jgi:hypothetical protein
MNGVSGTASLTVTAVVPTLVSIAVAPLTSSVAAGLTEQFSALGTYSDGSTAILTSTAAWASSNTTFATIAAGGLATALKQGTTTITATVSGVTGTTTLTVTAPVLDSIAVTPANASVPLGTLTQFTATGTYSDGSTQNLTSTVTWSSSNTTTATITAAGVVTALTLNGTTTITATSGTVSGSTGLTVVAATLTSIVIVTPSGPPPDTVTIANGTTYQFTALGLYNDGSKHNITSQVTWESSNTAAATFGAITGRALSVNPGQTTITATLDSLTGTATLVVTDATIQSIAVGPSSTTIAPLTTQTFAAIGTFNDGTTQNITHDVVWASNNAVATISNTAGSIGVATGVAPGGATATISATFGGMSGSALLIVSSATLQSITVTPASAGLAVNSNLALQAIGSFSDNSTQHIETVATWSSSAPTVVAVNGNIATGESSGSAAITCQLGGVTSNAANLTVGTFTAITITPGNGTVAEGTSINLVATGTLTNGTKQDITSSVLWTSSNPSVATISNASGSYGSATGVAPGTVTVIAAFAGQVGVASLTVTDATLSAITINPPSPIINLGDRQQFSATGKFSDGTTEDLSQQVIWTSSKPGVAIINSSGAISTTGTGTTMIEAAFGSVNDTTSLTVQ